MPIINTEILKNRWFDVLQPFPVMPTVSNTIFSNLVVAYSSPGRFYHTLKHIQQVLETIEEIQQLKSEMAVQINFSAIQLAAWFHDVIYEPQSKDNEEKSSIYASQALTQLNLPIDTIKLVQNLILNTKHHQASSNDIHSQIFLDADLAILGASQLNYKAYFQQIRQEYACIPNQLYYSARKEVLSSFLRRTKIYSTQQMFVELESRARLNIKSELADLFQYPDSK
ncbi:MAG: hypothetical protein WBG73_06755 [Coleofasciculaceae cyanobacterium]